MKTLWFEINQKYELCIFLGVLFFLGGIAFTIGTFWINITQLDNTISTLKDLSNHEGSVDEYSLIIQSLVAQHDMVLRISEWGKNMSIIFSILGTFLFFIGWIMWPKSEYVIGGFTRK